ncbi:uncharacterized protein PV09_04050 [Verruconis gallopava]|uniref:Uncharacterized protein n=1 Tax=Verruconis gallopava TaxID=253628 RepID=A0A0D2B0I3_9PEZI|nr:uncharacterized protein PV09_04050 [Verruconis gallopava]KIW04869.1 hypothetical protein PV09_04050 [Verruconis gallopava]
MNFAIARTRCGSNGSIFFSCLSTMSSADETSPLSQGMLTSGLVLRIIGVICAHYVLWFLYRLYVVRSLFRSVARDYGVPILPHSFLMGHLIEVGKLVQSLPPNTSGMYFPLMFARKYPEMFKEGVVYLDTWPFGPPMMAVIHPDMMAQFTQEKSMPKYELMKWEFAPLTGLNDLVNQEGQVWKMWRGIFNPGFSLRNILSFVPEIIEEVEVFKERLRELAASGGAVAEFEQPAMKLTMDVIGRVTLNTRMCVQTTNNPMYDSLRALLKWLITDHSPANMLKAINPARPLIIWYHNRVMNNYLKPFIQQAMSSSTSGSENRKTIVSLAAKAFRDAKKASAAATAENEDKDDDDDGVAFLDMAISQMKMFLFAGHETTAVTLNYAYHLLHSNPDALRRIRAEHDEVLGPNRDRAAERLVEKPQLLNALPYTSAVIKETLRLYAPVGSIRQGSKDLVLTHPETGRRYPTDGFMLYSNSMGSHRWGANCGDPDAFRPDRWLADAPPMRRHAYRPFELGPRNCIGQELAQLELRTILALTLRDFDVETALDPDGPSVFGDVCYQSFTSNDQTGKPVGGAPFRVRLRR